MTTGESNKFDTLRALSSKIRGSDRFSSARRLLVLASLSELAKNSGLENSWKDIRNTAVHYSDPRIIEDMIFALGTSIENYFEDLRNIYTVHLIRDIMLAGGSIPELVYATTELTSHIQCETIQDFAKFFDDALDDISSGPSLSETITPRPVAKLMVELCNLREHDAVLDLSCGQGVILAEIAKKRMKCVLSGQELNSVAAAVTSLRLFLIGDSAEISTSDALLAPQKNFDGQLKKFNVVLCDPPVGPVYQIFTSDVYESHRFGHRHSRLETAFVERAISMMKPNGRSVILLPYSFLSRRSDQIFRKTLLEAGLIEGVISLPRGVVPWTEVTYSLLVLNNPPDIHNNHPVKFLHAQQIFTADRKSNNRSSSAFIDGIADAYKTGGNIPGFAIKSNEEIARNDYKLSPSSWISKQSENSFDLEIALQSAQEIESDAFTVLEEVNELSLRVNALL